jgi:hypothetical protein
MINTRRLRWAVSSMCMGRCKLQFYNWIVCIFYSGSARVPSPTFIWTVHGHCIICYNVLVADVKLLCFYSPKGDCWFQNIVVCYIMTVTFIGYAFVFTKTLHTYCVCTLYLETTMKRMFWPLILRLSTVTVEPHFGWICKILLFVTWPCVCSRTPCCCPVAFPTVVLLIF